MKYFAASFFFNPDPDYSPSFFSLQALDGKPLVEGYDDDDVDGVPMPGDHDGVPLDLEALDKQKEQEEAERQAKLKFQASKWETVDESTLEAQVRSKPKRRRWRHEDERRKRESLKIFVVTLLFMTITRRRLRSNLMFDQNEAREGRRRSPSFSRVQPLVDDSSQIITHLLSILFLPSNSTTHTQMKKKYCVIFC